MRQYPAVGRLVILRNRVAIIVIMAELAGGEALPQGISRDRAENHVAGGLIKYREGVIHPLDELGGPHGAIGVGWYESDCESALRASKTLADAVEVQTGNGRKE